MSDEDEYVSVGEPIPRLASVRPGGGKSLAVAWEDGREATIDLAHHISRHKVFAPLADDAIFALVQLDYRGLGICWPDLPDTGIPATTLQAIENGEY